MDTQRRRILVIDDEEPLRNSLRRALTPEHDVILLERARDALACIEGGGRFDLVLCDLMLPGVTGMDFHDLVAGVAPEMVERIVFTTGGAYTERAKAFIGRTDIRHVDKPFPPLDGLRAMVRELLAHTARIRSR